MQCENPQHCSNGYYVIIAERIIQINYMRIDHISLRIQRYICFHCISRIDENITDWKVYNFIWHTLYIYI